MSMSITSATASAVNSSITPHMSPERQAFKQLRDSLKSGDIDGAKQAYAAVIKNAPAGATLNPDSAFAQVGKDLQSGDLSGAQTAFKSVLENGMSARHVQSGGPVSVPTSTDTGTGVSVNLTA